MQLEGEVASDILTYLGELPWLGSLIKLGKVGSNFIDLHFIYKIAKFLQQSEDIADEEKEKFLQRLDKKQRKEMYEYLIHLLYAVESAENHSYLCKNILGLYVKIGCLQFTVRLTTNIIKVYDRKN